MAGSLVVFLVSTTLFNRRIEHMLEGMLTDVKFGQFVKKMSNIFEGKNSLLDDLKASENTETIALGASSGLFFFLAVGSAFAFVLSQFNIGIGIIISLLVFLILYLYRDLSETDLLKEYQSEEKMQPFMYDLLETYTVNNSLKSFGERSPSKVFLRFGSRIIGPLCYVTLPKLGYDSSLVYKNTETISFIRDLTKGVNLRLEHQDGQSLDALFVEGQSVQSERITILSEKSPKENFPYLFDPNYSSTPKEQKKWCALSLVERDSHSEKTRCYVFINVYRGHSPRAQARERRANRKAGVKEILLLILVGERSYVAYIKTRVESLAARYPAEMLNLEEGLFE
jgi:hypothetical protein